MSRIKRASQIDAITEYLFVEGYADTIESAEAIAESISQEWAYNILNEVWKNNLAHKTGALTPSQKRAIENIARMNRGDYSVPPGGSKNKKSAKQVEPEQPEQQEQPKRKRRRLDFEVR